MNTCVRTIFWVMLLLIGLQWVGDPVEMRLTSDQSPVAGWHNPDENGPDNSHHFGVALRQDDLTPLDYAAHVSPVLRLIGPALLGWLLRASDSRNLQSLAISHLIPRAPPAA
ncbi:MAG TPA: hypothetical protein VLM91_09525 [Candidatus Methylomirabilis sp.]|nr:hypothetical protein [Candidatus Methylomirabilis sp.]